jgi:HK97 family phage major capsid protein
MAFNRGPNTLALTPDEHGSVYWQPLQDTSVALRPEVTTNIFTTSAKYRVPVVTDTPNAEWTAEGADIVLSDPTTTEVSVTPPKIAALTKMSRELADDSGGDAVFIVHSGMIRDLAQKIDEAFFGNPASVEAPNGLNDVAGVSTVQLTGAFANIDPFNEALSIAEQQGRIVTAFVGNPDTVLRLTNLKEATGSNRPLLQPDPAAPHRRLLGGVPLLSSQHVADNTVWAIPRDAALSVLRTPAELAMSEDAAFGSYSIMVRIVQRVGFLFPHAAAIVKVTDVTA